MAYNLNLTLSTAYNFTEQFDLVTNFGTSEHLLNQNSAFENIHNLCKNGGVMVHCLPCHGGMNHGFFNYSLKFFMRLGLFNGYRLLGFELSEVCMDEQGWSLRDSIKIDIDDVESIFEYIRGSKSREFELPRSCGSGGFYATLAFKKLSNKPFASPLDMPMHGVKSRETLEFFLGGETAGIKRAAIFGSAQAARVAREFLESCGVSLVCYIDDFKGGEIDGVRVVSLDEFHSSFASSCDAVFMGPLQRGDIKKRCKIRVIDMRWSWFG